MPEAPNDRVLQAVSALAQACRPPLDATADLTMREALARFLPDAGLATRVGYLCHVQGEIRAAIAAYRHALDMDARRFDLWFALGCAERDRGGLSQASEAFRHALDLRPDDARTHFERGRALFGLGHVEDAIDSLRLAARERSQIGRKALAAIAIYIPGDPRADNAAILQARSDWAALEREAAPAPSPRARVPPGRELRIGYVSAFFDCANWMKPVWGVINHHDRSRFAIVLLCDCAPPTPDCGYDPHAPDLIVDARNLSNAALADKIVELGIDVLVDLNGYSFQSRLALFMRRPAPMIVGWFNMYATTAIEAFDFIVGDHVVIPTQEERFYTEQVYRVPGSYLAFSVLYRVPEIAPPPCLTNGFITFGAFASAYKLTDAVIAAWSRILAGAPQARLLLKARALGDDGNRAALHERFRRSGADVSRLRLEGPDDHYRFLEAYAKVDVALDTFPYNGGTTTTEALWAGVPVLSFRGDRWASRTSETLLRAAGLDAWRLPDLDAYVDRAVSLAAATGTPTELAGLRSTLRERLAASPVCDSPGLCIALESLYARVRSH